MKSGFVLYLQQRCGEKQTFVLAVVLCSFLNKTIGFLCFDSRSLIFPWRTEQGKFRGGNKCQLLSVLLLPTPQVGSDCSNSSQKSCWSCVGRGWQWQWQGCHFHGCWSWGLALGMLWRASSGAGPGSVHGGVTALLLWQLLQLGREGTRLPGPVTGGLNSRARDSRAFPALGNAAGSLVY